LASFDEPNSSRAEELFRLLPVLKMMRGRGLGRGNGHAGATRKSGPNAVILDRESISNEVTAAKKSHDFSSADDALPRAYRRLQCFMRALNFCVFLRQFSAFRGYNPM
jgi:hypothetical protein